MKKISLVLFVLLAANAVFAQQDFLLKDASKNFDVRIKIAKCDLSEASYKTCEGRATVSLLKKSGGQAVQTLVLANMFLELNGQNKPTANLIELYGENNSGVVFDDYNFDGADDLALRNGNDGAYGGPSYDIFLFSAATKKFVKSRELTRLASENLGLFTPDKKAKTLETFNKSGCCYHETTRYRIAGNRPQKVFVFIEDATGADGTKVKLTTRTLLRGKWKTVVKYARTKDYYKEN